MTAAPASPVTVYSLSGTGLGPFATVWPFEDVTQVTALLHTPTADVALTLYSDFTLSGANYLGGGAAATLASDLLPGGGWAVGSTLTLRRATPIAQPAGLGAVDGFSPKTVEDALDHLTRVEQETAQKAADAQAAVVVEAAARASAVAAEQARAQAVEGTKASVTDLNAERDRATGVENVLALALAALQGEGGGEGDVSAVAAGLAAEVARATAAEATKADAAATATALAGKAPINFPARFAQSVAMPAIQKMGGLVSIREWDALAGTDRGHECSAAFPMAFADLISDSANARATLLLENGPGYVVGEHARDGKGGCAILNPGISMKTESRLGAPLILAAGAAADCDLMRIKPDVATNAGYFDFMRLSELQLLMYTPGVGALRGRHNLFFDGSGVSHCSQFVIDHCYFSQANGTTAFEMSVDPAVNPGGAPLGMTVRDCLFLSGVRLQGFSDNAKFLNLIVRDDNGLPGLELTPIVDAYGDQPSGIEIRGFNCDAGVAIRLHSGRNITIDDYDIELSRFVVDDVIDLKGDVQKLVNVKIGQGGIGVFGTGHATNIFASESAKFVTFSGHKVVTAGPGYVDRCWNLASGTSRVAIGKGGVSANIPAVLTYDPDVDIRGPRILRPFTDHNGTATAASQIGGQEVFSVQREFEGGMVSVFGSVNPGAASGAVIGCVPAAWKPTETVQRLCRCIIGGSAAMCTVFVSAGNGDITYGATGTATEIDMGFSYDLPPWDLDND